MLQIKKLLLVCWSKSQGRQETNQCISKPSAYEIRVKGKSPFSNDCLLSQMITCAPVWYQYISFEGVASIRKIKVARINCKIMSPCVLKNSGIVSTTLPTNSQVSELHAEVTNTHHILREESFLIPMGCCSFYRYTGRDMHAIDCSKTLVEERRKFWI